MEAQRQALGLLTLVVVSLIISLGVNLLSGDLVEAMLDRAATPETVEAFRRELRLDLPSKCGPIAQIMPSDGCGRDAGLLAVERWYDFPEFGGYPGNVGQLAFDCLLC